VADNVYLVFSTPPAEIAMDAFDRWYEQHVRDILTVEGFRAARRFHFDVVRGESSPAGYAHLSVYVVDGDAREAMERLGAATQSGQVPIPEWFERGRWASFHAAGIEGPIDLDALDHAYMVFSRPPDGMSLADFSDWYHDHARENCTATGFERMWRYLLEPDRIDAASPPRVQHAALYEVHGGLDELRAALKEAADAGRVGFPEWFDRILFVSLDAHAASAALAGAGA
jgi:hypothetical protein